MKIKKPNMDQPVTVFFAITIVSVGFMMYPLWNYTMFYVALWSFDYKLVNLTVNTHQITNSYVRIDAKLLVTNPTDYSGLKADSIMCGLEYIDGMHLVMNPVFHQRGYHGEAYILTDMWELKVETFNLEFQIAARTNDTIALTFVINPFAETEPNKTNAFTFMNFLGTRPKQIEWRLKCRSILSSFLGGFGVNRDFTHITPMTYS